MKPDGVNRALVGEIIARFERKGYKLVGAKVLTPSRELASLHYAEHDGRPFFPKLVDFLTSGAVVALVFEGRGIVAEGRRMIGATNPLASPAGTIRGDFGIDVGRNIIHGSDSVEVSDLALGQCVFLEGRWHCLKMLVDSVRARAVSSEGDCPVVQA